MKNVASDDSSPTSEHPALDVRETDSRASESPESVSPELDLTQSTSQAAGIAPAVGSTESVEGEAPSQPADLPAPPSDSSAGSSGSHSDLATGDIERDPTVISRRPVAVPAEFARSLSLVELARSREGRQLHHFAVGKMIGGGGMGAVFRGRDLRLDREVAIKVIPESRRDPETLRRFHMEAQSAARLDHPNIARVYDIGEDEAWNYIVFEFIDGINLRDLVQMEGPMSIDDAVFTTRQVAEALQHAHDRDVVHRDIKPSNVIITPTGIAKVVDMGLARNTAMDRSAADQTASGVTLGTFDYISPEQARDPRDADVRSDLYSLGCTLFYMLTGQPPFPDGTALQKLLNHGSQPPPDPRQWRDDISDQLYAVLAKLMAKRPADRYQKPIELINDLLLIAQLEGLPRSRSPGSILMRPTIAQQTLLETHLPWLVPMAALLISAFWLQSADSLTSSLELPFPTLRATQSASLPASAASELEDGRRRIKEAPRGASESQLSSPREPTPRETLTSPSPSLGPAPTSPSGADASPVIEPPMRAEAHETGVAPSPSAAERSMPGADQSPRPTPVGPLTAQSPPALELTPEGVSATTAQAVSALRSRLANSNESAASPLASGRESVSQPVGTKTGTGLPALGGSPGTGNSSSPTGAGTTATSTTASATGSGRSIEGSIEPRLPSPLAQDTIVVSRSEPSDLSSNARWSSSLAEALARAAMVPEVQVIELRDSIELNHMIAIPRSGLTLRAAAGHSVQVVLNGEQAYGMGWESWIEVQRVALRCERIAFTCRNNMRQTQAIFAVQGGGRLELVECTATMESNRGAPLGSCVLVSEPDRQRDIAVPATGVSSASTEENTVANSGTGSRPSAGPLAIEMPVLTEDGTPAANASTPSSASSPSSAGSSSGDSEPVSIALSNCVVRGNQNLVTMRTACRAEITLEKTCAILEGRVLAIRGVEQDRMPPVVRLNMELSTLVTRQGFASVQTGFALRAPLTLMRRARLCAFWSPAMVPHIVVDGIADQGVLDELLQLRGEENAYDQKIETLCQCRFADGKHIDFSFRDATGEWFRERGNDNMLRWQNAVPPERPLEEQMPDDYRLRAGMFVPGFPPSATTPPRLEGDAQD